MQPSESLSDRRLLLWLGKKKNTGGMMTTQVSLGVPATGEGFDSQCGGLESRKRSQGRKMV